MPYDYDQMFITKFLNGKDLIFSYLNFEAIRSQVPLHDNLNWKRNKRVGSFSIKPLPSLNTSKIRLDFAVVHCVHLPFKSTQLFWPGDAFGNKIRDTVIDFQYKVKFSLL